MQSQMLFLNGLSEHPGGWRVVVGSPDFIILRLRL